MSPRCIAALSQLFRGRRPLTQAALPRPRAVALVPGPAGTRQRLVVRHGAGRFSYALRAIDANGNVGPVHW